MRSKETYIGDAVYASFDGYQIWLRTGDGSHQEIALEPDTLANLLTYATGIGLISKPDQSHSKRLDTDTPS